jgi:uncharacterized membrane protein YidH (DUF202 family)
MESFSLSTDRFLRWHFEKRQQMDDLLRGFLCIVVASLHAGDVTDLAVHASEVEISKGLVVDDFLVTALTFARLKGVLEFAADETRVRQVLGVQGVDAGHGLDHMPPATRASIAALRRDPSLATEPPRDLVTYALVAIPEAVVQLVVTAAFLREHLVASRSALVSEVRAKTEAVSTDPHADGLLDRDRVVDVMREMDVKRAALADALAAVVSGCAMEQFKAALAAAFPGGVVVASADTECAVDLCRPLVLLDGVAAKLRVPHVHAMRRGKRLPRGLIWGTLTDVPHRSITWRYRAISDGRRVFHQVQAGGTWKEASEQPDHIRRCACELLPRLDAGLDT